MGIKRTELKERLSQSSEAKNAMLNSELELDLPPAARAIRKAMREQGLRNCDILDIFNGHSGRASEILRGRRAMSKALALKLSKRLNVPVEELLA